MNLKTKKRGIMKKKLLIGVGILTAIMLMTNPGRLKIGLDFCLNYQNYVFFSVGSQLVQYMYSDDEYIVDYIGTFNNFFCFVQNKKSGEKYFEIIASS